MTHSTPARLYQLRSKSTISPAAGSCSMYRRDVRSVRRTTAAVRTQAGPVWPDPIDGLKGVYGAHVTRDIALRLTERAATAYLERDPELHRSTSCAAGSRTCCSSRAWWAI